MGNSKDIKDIWRLLDHEARVVPLDSPPIQETVTIPVARYDELIVNEVMLDTILRAYKLLDSYLLPQVLTAVFGPICKMDS